MSRGVSPCHVVHLLFWEDKDLGKKTETNYKSRCAISNKCGGCRFIDMEYEKHLAKKQNHLQELLKPYGHVEKIIGMEHADHYRCKVNAAFQRRKDGSIVAGVYEGGTHNVLPSKDCLIENASAQKIIEDIGMMVRSFKIPIYDEDRRSGILRHVMVRVGLFSKQIMVVLVTAGPMFPSKNNFVKVLLSMHPEITTVVQNINERQTSMVLGNCNRVMYGKGYIEDVLCNKRFRISPTSFYQVNPAQTEILYQTAVSFAGLTGKECVIDVYCGTGTIGIVASNKAKEVVGVETNREATADAAINAKANGVKNIRFVNKDAGAFMIQMANNKQTCDVVFMDPPRSGSSPEFLKALSILKPKKIVYIACGQESLARDLKILTARGEYKVERMVGVDMFPWTEHVETVCLLSKKG